MLIYGTVNFVTILQFVQSYLNYHWLAFTKLFSFPFMSLIQMLTVLELLGL